MSIYGGLPTRQSQKNYNRLLCRILNTIQLHLLEMTKNFIPLQWSIKYRKIIAKMETIEEHKYMAPKFSQILKPLLLAINNSLQKKQKNGEKQQDQKQSKDKQKIKLYEVPEQELQNQYQQFINISKNNAKSCEKQTKMSIQKLPMINKSIEALKDENLSDFGWQSSLRQSMPCFNSNVLQVRLPFPKSTINLISKKKCKSFMNRDKLKQQQGLNKLQSGAQLFVEKTNPQRYKTQGAEQQQKVSSQSFALKVKRTQYISSSQMSRKKKKLPQQ